jgi:translation initiation factor IF-3
VVDADGEMLGVMDTERARALAREKGLDLVEVAANTRPPVCRIMDFGKYKYEQSKKERKARSRQHQQQLKEVKLRPKIERHDLEVKIRAARRFLTERHKVKVTMNFRGREVTHAEIRGSRGLASRRGAAPASRAHGKRGPKDSPRGAP